MYTPVPTEDAGDPGTNGTLTQADLKIRLGMAKTIDVLGGMEKAGACKIEQGSVYGAAIAVPQIARSAGYPTSMLALAFRAYLFVLLNYFAQTLFVYYIYDSQTNMNPFGGQMHLCDFAAHISNCPDAPGCDGPGGEQIADPGALYPFDIWITRKLFRDSMLILFPDRKSDILNNVDPGEYGLESYYCRWLCIFIFVLQIADEFQNIRDLVHTLWKLPSEGEPWIEYNPPAKDAHGHDELDYVTFRVAGIPRGWKVWNILFVLMPRIFIWRMLTMAGVHFLMETAAMVDQIVNTTALSFVLTTDELILERLATKATRHIMEGVKARELFDDSHLVGASDQETLDRYYLQELSFCHSGYTFPLFPKRLFWTILLMALFVIEYYVHNCVYTEDGALVSKDVFLPVSAHMDLWCFFNKFFSISTEKHVEEPFWSMPHAA